ncbi:hypothetical protein ACIRO3_29665 [Streptomyces sp. NPDC102278]|uniref:hypothetical protein n=1 Tax=Streptomyces sp. NPDC102278 TaxID=3366152 RepID=UPI0038285955
MATTTIGDLFDVAVTHLRQVARTPLGSLQSGERSLPAREVDGLLLRVQDGLGPQAYTPVPTSEERKLTDMERDLRGWLVQARGALGTARQYLSPQAETGGPAAKGVIAASQAVGAVRDTIGSHLGPDRAPLTPYAYLLREQDAFDYLASRYSEVAWAAGQVVHRLAQEAEYPRAGAALDRAWRSLDRASVNVRASSPDTDRVFGSFSAALPVRPTHAGRRIRPVPSPASLPRTANASLAPRTKPSTTAPNSG